LDIFAQATPTPMPDSLDDAPGVVLQKLLYQIPGWPVDNALLSFLLTLLVWTAIAALAYWLLFHLLRRLVGQTRTDADNVVLRTVRVPVFVAIVAYGLVTAISELGLRPNIGLIVNRLYTIVLIAVGFYLAWRIVKEVILRWLERHSSETEIKIDDLLVPLINTVGPFIFFMVALVLVLQYAGVDVGLLAASIGVVGLVVGLAFQDTLSNLFSGIYLILDPPFRQHDLIILSDHKIYGVERVGLRMTQLYDMSNHALIYTPNSELTKATISNITKPTVDLKVTMSMHAAYGNDPQYVVRLLNEILESHRNVLGLPADKLGVLRKRLEQMNKLAGESGTTLDAAVADLDAWHQSRKGEDPETHAKLVSVRKELNSRLAEAQAALKQLPDRGDIRKPVAVLRQLLGGSAAGADPDSMDQGRMTLISTALEQIAEEIQGSNLTTLQDILGAVEELDRRENILEMELADREEEENKGLEERLSTLDQASETVVAALKEAGLEKEAARISLWSRNIAILYAHMAVEETLAGMDRELDGIIEWLRELEAGGITKTERARIRGVFGQWGGINMMEKRRVAELHRRVMRWLRLKEEDMLPPSEYRIEVLAWERKLRLLSRKLRDSREDDEDALDTRLSAIKQWLHSVNFWDSLADWKLPGAGFKEFGEHSLEFGLAFYVDDIKLEHFTRRGRVVAQILMDIYEVFGREKISIPVKPRDIWSLGSPPERMGSNNGSILPAYDQAFEPTRKSPVPYTHDFDDEDE